MDYHQPYRSFKKIFDSITEGINKGIRGENNEMSEYTQAIGKLRGKLDEIVRNIQEIYNLPEIEEYRASMGFNYNIDGNDVYMMDKRYTIIIKIYSKDEMIECESYDRSDKIMCTHYSSESFELPDSIYFIKDIKGITLDTYNTLYPGKLENSDKQYLVINVDASINPNKPIGANPKIVKHKVDKYRGNAEYNDEGSNIRIIWSFYDL